MAFLAITFNGLNLPIEQLTLNHCLLSSHALFHLPIGSLAFLDSYQLVERLITPADGVSVVIKLGYDQASAKTHYMKVFNLKKENTDNGTLYQISLIADHDKWRLTPYKGAIKSSSNLAIADLANACDMNYNGSAANDSQVWLPLNDPPCKFARRIAKAGYFDTSSVFALGVTLEGEIRYINLATVPLKNVFNFTHGSEEGVWVTDWKLTSRAGFNNQLGGYMTQSSQYEPNLAKHLDHSKVTARRLSATVNVNADSVAKGASKVVIHPISSGNNHANSLAAKHQNERLRKLLSQTVNLLTPMNPDCSLFDAVYFTNHTANGKTGQSTIDAETSGYYLVMGKSRYIDATGIYYERYNLAREGFGRDTSGKTQ